MAEDATYQTKVYHERPGDATVFKSDGILRGHSGGIMSAESGFVFTLASQDVLTKDMVRTIHSQNVPYTITPAALSVKLTGYENLPANVRFVTIIGSVAMSQASFWLTSCSAGAEVYLRLVGDLTGAWTNANTSVYVSLSGCILLGSVGDKLSSLELHTSAASDCMVHLIAPADNVWAIVNQYGSANVENAFS